MDDPVGQQFKELMGSPPYPWQRELYRRLIEGEPVEGIDVPTGLGKTAVMAVWLLAITTNQAPISPRLPRRLVYVVNRRTIVDQATRVVEQLREMLQPEDGRAPAVALVPIRDQLVEWAGEGQAVFGVSTLRGQRADSQQWRRHPVGRR